MNTLVIVDFQKDFSSTEGSLYVNGAEQAKENVIAEIKSGKYDRVILTLDWHNLDDKSFEVNGGQWPIHCLKSSWGSSIEEDIINACISQHINYDVFLKGTDSNVEEYGAFVSWVKDGDYIVMMNSDNSSSVEIPVDSNVYVCGLAGDYCVYETWKNLRNIGINVIPLYDCMGFIGETFEYGI